MTARSSPDRNSPRQQSPAENSPVSWSAALELCAQAGIGPLVQLALLAASQALLPVAGLLAMMHLVDAVADGIARRTPTEQAFDAALLATAVAAGVAFAGGLLRSLASVVSENHGRRLGDAGIQHLQERTAQIALLEFDKPGFHDSMQRAGQEAGQRPVRLSQDLTAILVALLSLASMAMLLAQVELWLPVLVGLAAVPLAWARRRHARLRFAWHRDQVVQQRQVGYLGATLSGRATAKDVRVLGLASPFGQRLQIARQDLRTTLAKLARMRARDELLVHTLASAALFGAYVYLATDALAGAMTLGGLVLHAQAAQRTQNAVRDLLAAWAGVQEHRLFLRPLVDFLAAYPSPSPPQAVAACEPHAASFTASGLHFRYPESQHDILQGIDLHISPGERVALVGANGSGKSTLVKLLSGLYAPTGGELQLDEQSIHAMHDGHRRQRIAVLLQDASTFELTLRENLQLGHLALPSEESLWHALELVGLQERVRSLPLGLDSPMSRRLAGGVDWSVGEARRIVLARILARPADALLLDEPFASLDGRTATSIATHLAELPRSRTLLLVDHRGPALRCVDRVIWLDRGRVVAVGTPEDITRQPLFAEQFPDWLPGP